MKDIRTMGKPAFRKDSKLTSNKRKKIDIGAIKVNIASYIGLGLDADGIQKRFASIAVRSMTSRAVPKCFKKSMFD